jgi:hypothetical protein
MRWHKCFQNNQQQKAALQFGEPLCVWLACVGSAGFEASLAGGGALLAVFVLVLSALVVAFPTNFDALFQHVPGVVGAPRDEGGRKAADVGAVAVEANAGHHHGDVGLGQAGIGAHFAGGDAAADGIKHGAIVAPGAVGGSRHLHDSGGKSEKNS